MATKILALGSVHGQLEAILKKLAKLHSKTPFSLALVTGDLFADPASSTDLENGQVDSLLSGSMTVPLPVYFTVGRHPLPQKVVERLKSSNDEVCPNLFYLGKRSTFKTSEGLRIVSLGGVLDPQVTSATPSNEVDKYTPLHGEADAKALHGAHNADILLTTVWPEAVTSRSKIDLATDRLPLSEKCVADLCMALKPRYHLSASDGSFYEREPFFHDKSDDISSTRSFTRFISLAPTTSKSKSLYGFQIDISAPLPAELPAGTTAAPFSSTTKRPLNGQTTGSHNGSGQPGFFDLHSNGQQAGYGRNKRRKRGDHTTRRPPTQAECFFCLSNPDTVLHLIVAIGDEAYMTTSRGPVTTSSSLEDISASMHMLIIPLAHSPTVASITNAGGGSEAADATFAEMTRFRNALDKTLLDRGRGKYGSVCWEINRRDGVHAHWQWLPVRAELLRKGLVEAGFRVEAENQGYGATFEKDRNIGDGRNVDSDWFRVWLWTPPGDDEPVKESKNGEGAAGIDNGIDKTDSNINDSRGTTTELLLPLDDGGTGNPHHRRFDLQFGRRVMAKLWGTPARAHWRDALEPEAEEQREADAFKQLFRPHDFTAAAD